MKRWVVVSMLALLASSLSGCFGYAYQQRSSLPAQQHVAIDRHRPHADTRWSFVWGLVGSEWAPVECSERNTSGDCVQWLPVCAEAGPGRVEVSFRWYSAVMALLTLGMATPARVTVYCSTEQGVDPGP
jgi:hypothetical protein